MPDGDGSEPITGDELLYRRIPASQGWYDPQFSKLNRLAFNPIKFDTTGLSLARGKYKSAELIAVGQPGKQYYLAELRAQDLYDNGINVVPNPLPGDPGHAEIPSMTYESRKSTEVLEAQILLAEKLTLRVLGPFPEHV